MSGYGTGRVDQGVVRTEAGLAVEKAWEFARLHFGEGSARADHFIERLAANLRAGKVAQVTAQLRGLKTANQNVQKALDALVKYYTDNATRMRYDEYLRKGYGIGSGAVESAHKQVVHARLRQAGMRWSEAGARRLLALRVLLLNHSWGQLDRLSPQRRRRPICAGTGGASRRAPPAPARSRTPAWDATHSRPPVGHRPTFPARPLNAGSCRHPANGAVPRPSDHTRPNLDSIFHCLNCSIRNFVPRLDTLGGFGFRRGGASTSLFRSIKKLPVSWLVEPP